MPPEFQNWRQRESTITHHHHHHLAFKLSVKRPGKSRCDLCVHQLSAFLSFLVAPEEVEDDAAGLLLAASHLDGKWICNMMIIKLPHFHMMIIISSQGHLDGGAGPPPGQAQLLLPRQAKALPCCSTSITACHHLCRPRCGPGSICALRSTQNS